MRTEIYRHENGEWRWRFRPVESPEERSARQARISRVVYAALLGFSLFLLGDHLWHGTLTLHNAAQSGSLIVISLAGLMKNRKIQIAFWILAILALVVSSLVK